MVRFLALLLGVMLTAMSVPAPAMMAGMARQDVGMADCTTMLTKHGPAEHGNPGLPMGADCQKCCLATLALPLPIAQPVLTPVAPMPLSMMPLVAHRSTPEPPPPRLA